VSRERGAGRVAVGEPDQGSVAWSRSTGSTSSRNLAIGGALANGHRDAQLLRGQRDKLVGGRLRGGLAGCLEFGAGTVDPGGGAEVVAHAWKRASGSVA